MQVQSSTWAAQLADAINRQPEVAKQSSAVGQTGFGELVQDALADVNLQQQAADQAVESLVNGETDNIHDVVLTAVKADLSVRMLLEIRNQLVQAYQEVMRMQL